MNFATELAIAVVLTGAAGTGAIAQPILVDFELLPGMVNQPGAAIPAASQLSDQYLATHGVRFTSGAGFVPVVIHGPGTPSGTRIIGGSTPTGLLTYEQTYPIVATFSDPTGAIPMVVTVASIRGDLFSIPGTKTLEAFDLSGAMIASQTLQDSDPSPVMVSATGIHSVRFYSSSATVGFDDLRFDTPMPSCRADFNRDGTVDLFDYLDFVDAFASNLAAADFNVDGVIDFFDYLDFVDAFARSC